MTHALHLEFAKKYWTKQVRPGDCIIDATCGNGHDTLFLCSLLQGQGELIAIDIQETALENTAFRLQTLSLELQTTVRLVKGCHATLPKTSKSPHLIVYNLGYLPGGDKSATTRTETTLESIQCALHILGTQGAISIMCYPGHEEGRKETQQVLSFLIDQKDHYTTERYQYTQSPIHRSFGLNGQLGAIPAVQYLTNKSKTQVIQRDFAPFPLEEQIPTSPFLLWIKANA
jgi:hypothetical protein